MSIAATAAIAGILVIGPLTAGLSGARAGQDPDRGTAPPQRFDMLVREDFFSGFAGNAAALERGMRKCEEVLANDPKNAEALVWHGSGLSFSAKKEFMASNLGKGRQIQAQGVQEMNEAVAMKPEDVAVLIPRASVFLSAALHVPSLEVARKDFQLAVNDYEKILRLQAPSLLSLPVHARGELLGGLAEAWNGLGDMEKSRGYLKRITEELPDTPYGRRAKEALASAKSGALGTTCLGCHVVK
jgi:tetratricopeptide (TPR) repeat protein